MATDRLLKNYTYIKTGGPADEIVEAHTTQQLIDTVNHCRHQHQRFYILGGGSNTIFSDAGFRGTVILNRSRQVKFDLDQASVTADSGVPISLLVNQSIDHRLSGLEWYLGLPGTVGGAIYNNSHFKTHLFSENIQSVTVLTETGEVIRLSPDQLEFDYDYSRFHHTAEIILSAALQLSPASDPANVAARAQESLLYRSSRQPLSLPSSGCIFKNPDSGPSAGQLIDQAGLKNTQVGGAVVSPIHANFIVNSGQATTTDIYNLAQQIETTVLKQFGVRLQKEAFFINEFGERIN